MCPACRIYRRREKKAGDTERLRKRRESWREQGRCPVCGRHKESEVTTVMCKECLERKSIAAKARYRKKTISKIRLGICAASYCENEAIHKERLCGYHSEMHSELCIRWHKNRVENRICLRCPDKLEEEYPYQICEKCRVRISNRRSRNAAKARKTNR